MRNQYHYSYTSHIFGFIDYQNNNGTTNFPASTYSIRPTFPMEMNFLKKIITSKKGVLKHGYKYIYATIHGLIMLLDMLGFSFKFFP